MEHAHLNACVGNNGGPYDLYDYAHGYFQAAQALLAESRKPGAIIDILVYPACLTFRHAVELFLKYLVTELARLAETDDIFTKNHRLSKNWETAKRLLAKTKFPASAVQIATLDTVVKALEDIDPRGETFRYPESFKNEQHLAEWSLINLVLLDQRREETFGVCHDWHGSLEAMLEEQREWRAGRG